MPEEQSHTTDMTGGGFRRIYSGYLTSKRVASVSMAAEAWFWRLHSIADDYGNFQGDPFLVWKSASGRRNMTIEQAECWTQEIIAAGLAYPYYDDEEVYIHIVDFEVKQIAGTKNGKKVQRWPIHPDRPRPECELRDSEVDARNPRDEPECQNGSKKSKTHYNQNQNQNYNQNQNHPPSPPKGGSDWPSFSLLLPESMRTDRLKAAWTSWVEYRGQKLKPATLRLQAKRLIGFGHEGAIGSIEQSIGQTWTGLFPVRVDRNWQAPKPMPKPMRNEGIANEADDHAYQRAMKKWREENGK